MKKSFCRLAALLLVIWMTPLQASELVELNIDSSLRTAEEKARDAFRQPEETLRFFGLEKEMTVIELFPGKGWYTKLLGPYLRDNGQLFVAVGTSRLGTLLDQPEAKKTGLDKVQVTGHVEGFEKTGLPGFIFDIEAVDFQQQEVDMVLTFRNAHNLTESARLKLNQAAFDALKPGGVYAVVDHTRRHMAPLTAEAWRRVDPVQIIKEAVAAGFVFEDYSTLHARGEDNLVYDSRHESLPRESDRFSLKFRKPRASAK